MTLILPLELKYFRRNLIIFVIDWIFQILKPKVIQYKDEMKLDGYFKNHV